MVRVLRTGQRAGALAAKTVERVQSTPEMAARGSNSELIISAQAAARRARSPLALGQGGRSRSGAVHRSRLAVMTIEKKFKS